jgi:hypothetical protein
VFVVVRVCFNTEQISEPSNEAKSRKGIEIGNGRRRKKKKPEGVRDNTLGRNNDEQRK